MARTNSATMLPIGSPKIGPIELDCAIDETHTWPSAVTRVPVESGAERSQFITKRPYMLRITATISELAVDRRKMNERLAANIAGSAIGVGAGLANQQPDFQRFISQSASDGERDRFRQGVLRVQQGTDTVAAVAQAIVQPPLYGVPEYTQSDKFRVALDRLLTLRESDTPFDYISPLGVVRNLVFENLEIPVDTTADLLFRAQLVQWVESGLTRTRSLTEFQRDASSDATNAGSRTTTIANIPNLIGG